MSIFRGRHFFISSDVGLRKVSLKILNSRTILKTLTIHSLDHTLPVINISSNRLFVNYSDSLIFTIQTAFLTNLYHVKGFKKVRSAIKLYSYYFSYNMSNDINVTESL